ncbi:MAG: EAL domain-containing protein, partial [Gammaproteobacteria bacterium]|nr:EAL domain-containing protein [Gammaproteobacteria bacterium]
EYQPQLLLKDNSIRLCEAQLLWRHQGQALRPVQFMPLVEKQRLSLKLTDWMLAEVASQIKAWDKKGLNWLKVSVNLSLLDLQDPKLAQRICAALARHELKPERLVLEFTDQFGIRDMASMGAMLHDLCERGFSLALGHFGRGLSALSMLRDLPIDLLKLDLAAIKTGPSGKPNGQLLNALVALASSLELRLLVDGVNSAEELQLITEAGCHGYQGDCCSPPLASRALPKFIRHWHS